MRILAVDDDPGTRNVVSKLLSKRGYDVDTAGDGPGALEMLRQHHYDLAVLDYQMPLMNGVELYRHMTQLQPDIVGIFLTAYTRLDIVYPAVGAGITRVLAKPVDSAELVGLVEELVGSTPDNATKQDGATDRSSDRDQTQDNPDEL